MKVTLLEDKDFGEISNLLETKVSEWEDVADTVKFLTEEINEEGGDASDKKLRAFKQSLTKLKVIANEIHEYLDTLLEKANSNREERMVEVAKIRFEDLSRSYSDFREKASIAEIDNYVSRRKTILNASYSERNTYMVQGSDQVQA